MPTPLSSPAQPKTTLRRVAILFSGGPAPAANAVIASAASCFSRAGIEVLGVRQGYTNLVKRDPAYKPQRGVDYIVLNHESLEAWRNEGRIIIGTARANPGKKLKTPADLDDPEKTAPMLAAYEALRSLEVDALISIGGDDTLTTAMKFKLFQDRLPKDRPRVRVVHLPKTIDNDYAGIDFTFGYFTAVEMLAEELYNLLADAASSGAYYLAQVMGRQAAWLAYGAAIAGESSLVIGLEDIAPQWRRTENAVDPATGKEVLDAKTGKPLVRDVIDVPSLVSRIVDTIQARREEGKSYGVIVVAEGMAEYLPQAEIRECLSQSEYVAMKADEFGHFPVSQLKFSTRLGRLAAEELKRRTGEEQKIVGLQFGYEVRCKRPTAFDVILGSQIGVGAYRALAEKGLDGVMVSVGGPMRLSYEPFEKLIDLAHLRARARPITPGEDFHQLARYLEAWVAE